MLNTYIKNRGYTKTIIHDNNSHKHNTLNAVNELNWDADYDGDVANISVTSDTNGEKKHFNISLDNNDLENILNIPSVDMPIHKRLQKDFYENDFRNEPTIYKIELPQIEVPQLMPIEPTYHNKINTLEKLLETSKPIRYLSTPLPNEEFVIPISANKQLHNLKPKTHTRHKKTHKTYRVHKKYKTTSPKKYSRRSSRRTSRTISRPFTF
jgi:hypothetical protein